MKGEKLISSDTFWNEIKERFDAKGGVYRIHCFVDANYKRLIPISRVLGIDEDGILYIGQSISFIKRLPMLKRALLNKGAGAHICGRRYWNNAHKKFRKTFPYEKLCVSFIHSDTPKGIEKSELSAYCGKYGEPPPLNSFE